MPWLTNTGKDVQISLATGSASTKAHERWTSEISGRPRKENSYSQIKRTDKDGPFIQRFHPPSLRKRQALHLAIKLHRVPITFR